MLGRQWKELGGHISMLNQFLQCSKTNIIDPNSKKRNS